jgi:hypothetical protein
MCAKPISGEFDFVHPIALAKRAGDSIPFIFALSAVDRIHTTFTYDKAADSWQWVIDNAVNGHTQRFADVRLNRVP